MQLQEFIGLVPLRKRKYLRESLAKNIGVTTAAIGHWCTGYRQPSPFHAKKLEEFTGGKVPRKDSRSDIYGV